jgi:putative FmdB family regulatory protein
MPNYEYRCIDCNHKFEIFLTYQEYEKAVVKCPACGHPQPERVIRPVRISRAEQSRMDDLSDPSLLDGLDDDPQTLGKMMRQMSTELGEDMGPEFDEVVDRLEKGQTPEEIERDLPDLGADGGTPGPDLAI